MKKIRINELARELEVKPGIILDLLPDLGVREEDPFQLDRRRDCYRVTGPPRVFRSYR